MYLDIVDWSTPKMSAHILDDILPQIPVGNDKRLPQSQLTPTSCPFVPRVDEFGPLNLQPRPGRAWRPAGRPARLRATYRRTGGVRPILGALDLATGTMTYRIRERKRWREFQALVKLLRSRWPAGQLYVTCDNFSPHKHPKVTGWAAKNNVALVFLPTYSSWLNWIEPEFAGLRYFALGGTDHRTHAWQGEMIDKYMRWRNARAQPKRNFAAGSVIRTWTGYQTNVA